MITFLKRHRKLSLLFIVLLGFFSYSQVQNAWEAREREKRLHAKERRFVNADDLKHASQYKILDADEWRK
jgi:hypothetical protein